MLNCAMIGVSIECSLVPVSFTEMECSRVVNCIELKFECQLLLHFGLCCVFLMLPCPTTTMTKLSVLGL